MSESAVSCMEGIFRVEKKDKAFIVKGKKSTASEWLKKYEAGACAYTECGPPILADPGLRALLRTNTDLNIEPVFQSPYRVPISLQGGLWLGPEEDENWDKKTEAEVLEVHKQAIARYAEEDESDRKEREKAKEDEDEDTTDMETVDDDLEL
jgi:hypothetical protein